MLVRRFPETIIYKGQGKTTTKETFKGGFLNVLYEWHPACSYGAFRRRWLNASIELTELQRQLNWASLVCIILFILCRAGPQRYVTQIQMVMEYQMVRNSVTLTVYGQLEVRLIQCFAHRLTLRFLASAHFVVFVAFYRGLFSLKELTWWLKYLNTAIYFLIMRVFGIGFPHSHYCNIDHHSNTQSTLNQSI